MKVQAISTHCLRNAIRHTQKIALNIAFNQMYTSTLHFFYILYPLAAYYSHIEFV